MSEPSAVKANPNGVFPADSMVVGPAGYPRSSMAYVLMLFVPRSVTTRVPPSGLNAILSRVGVAGAQRARRVRQRDESAVLDPEAGDVRGSIVQHVYDVAAHGHARRRGTPRGGTIAEAHAVVADRKKGHVVAAGVHDEKVAAVRAEGDRALRGQVRLSTSAATRRNRLDRRELATRATREDEHLVPGSVVGLHVDAAGMLWCWWLTRFSGDGCTYRLVPPWSAALQPRRHEEPQ
jgi:hypothetical protein